MPLLHVTDRFRSKWRNKGVDLDQHQRRQSMPGRVQTIRTPPPPPSADSLLCGIGEYIFLQRLGQGKFSKVMLAQHVRTGEKYAIKIIDKRIHDYRIVSRLAREINLMASLDHPHIVHLYETFETADSLFLVMEYIRGVNLDEHMQQCRHLDEVEARKIFRQLVSAVDYCHSQHIVHRDLKAPNVLLTPEGQVHLADFGLGNRFGLQRLKTICGSMLYYSPEIITGQKYVGPEIDCWCLGILLFRMVSGYEPFGHARTVGELKHDVVNGYYPMPMHLSDSLQATIRKCLACDKKDRMSIRQALYDDPWLNDDGHLPSPFATTSTSTTINSYNNNNSSSSYQHPSSSLLMEEKQFNVHKTIVYHPINTSIYFTGSATTTPSLEENAKTKEMLRAEHYQHLITTLNETQLRPMTPNDSSSFRLNHLFYKLYKRITKADHLTYYTMNTSLLPYRQPADTLLMLVRLACELLGITYRFTSTSTTELVCVLTLRQDNNNHDLACDPPPSPVSLPQPRHSQSSATSTTSWTSRLKRLSHSQRIGSTWIYIGGGSSALAAGHYQTSSPPSSTTPNFVTTPPSSYEDGTVMFSIETLSSSSVAASANNSMMESIEGNFTSSSTFQQQQQEDVAALRFSKISGCSKVFKLATGWINGVLLSP